MRLSSPASLCALAFALALGACASIDSERSAMRGAIATSERLGQEISTWRSALPAEVPASVIDSIEAFQQRAEEARGILGDLSAEATAGVDLTALKQALDAVVKFDTSTFAAASPTARNTLLDQLAGLAKNLQASAGRTEMRT